MMPRLTNKMLNQLLLGLGFMREEIVERNHRKWRHPQSGCTVLLPDNKSLDTPRPADLVAIQAHLDRQGHLDAADFDYFLAAGELPARIDKM